MIEIFDNVITNYLIVLKFISFDFGIYVC